MGEVVALTKSIEPKQEILAADQFGDGHPEWKKHPSEVRLPWTLIGLAVMAISVIPVIGFIVLVVPKVLHLLLG